MQVGSHELFWCHYCNRNHDVCREAPLCGISIVTWNFSFELVLSFALFGQGLWEAPVLTTVLQRQRFMHWDGPSLMVQLWSPMWYVQNTSPKIVCDLEIMKKISSHGQMSLKHCAYVFRCDSFRDCMIYVNFSHDRLSKMPPEKMFLYYCGESQETTLIRAHK